MAWDQFRNSFRRTGEGGFKECPTPDLQSVKLSLVAFRLVSAHVELGKLCREDFVSHPFFTICSFRSIPATNSLLRSQVTTFFRSWRFGKWDLQVPSRLLQIVDFYHLTWMDEWWIHGKHIDLHIEMTVFSGYKYCDMLCVDLGRI